LHATAFIIKETLTTFHRSGILYITIICRQGSKRKPFYELLEMKRIKYGMRMRLAIGKMKLIVADPGVVEKIGILKGKYDQIYRGSN
jgi:hypothetical protein